MPCKLSISVKYDGDDSLSALFVLTNQDGWTFRIKFLDQISITSSGSLPAEVSRAFGDLIQKARESYHAKKARYDHKVRAIDERRADDLASETIHADEWYPSPTPPYAAVSSQLTYDLSDSDVSQLMALRDRPGVVFPEAPVFA